MKFGPVPLTRAKGAILAHSQMTQAGKIPKGRVLTDADLQALAQAVQTQVAQTQANQTQTNQTQATQTVAALTHVTVARLDPGDVAEDAAALALARALVPDPVAAGLSLTAPHAGRVNLVATRPGIVALDPMAVLRLNRIDPSLTLATLALHARVVPGTLVATVKVIAYAVAGEALAAAIAALTPAPAPSAPSALAPSAPVPSTPAPFTPAIFVRPVTRPTATLILTRAGEPDRLVQKGRDAVARRLSRLGMTLTDTVRVAHDEAALAQAIAAAHGDLILILTGAATSDLHDTAPQALRRAGGQVLRFGMPVDPGNLLFLGTLGPTPVIGLPGCTRSPALNGADWVLERLACGLTLSDDDIAAMGVGGLLKEIPTRGEPRQPSGTPPRSVSETIPQEVRRV